MAKNINQKLFDLQQEIGSISKDAKNPFFNSNYFDVNSLIKQLHPLLKKHKLLLTQPLQYEAEVDKEFVVSKLQCIESGDYTESRKRLSEQVDPQKLGSEITYYRRYTLQSLLALQAEDDDGNAASGKVTEKPKDWLNLNTPQFTKAIEYIKNGGSVEAIKSKYKVSKKVADELSKL